MRCVFTFVLFALVRVIILTSGFLLLYFQIFREFFSVFNVDSDHHLGKGLRGNQTFNFFFAVFFPDLHIILTLLWIKQLLARVA